MAFYPEVIRCGKAKDFEGLAVAMRTYFGAEAAKKVRLPVRQVLEEFGFQVFPSRQYPWGSLAVEDRDGRVNLALGLRPGLGAVEERFLLAHLLGYFLFAYQPRIIQGQFQSSGYSPANSPLVAFENQDTELDHFAQDASAFAAALLMPKGMILRAMDSLTEVSRVADFFGTSDACVERRLQQLHSLTTAAVRDPAQVYPSPPSEKAPVPKGRKSDKNKGLSLHRLRELAGRIDPNVIR